MGGTAEAEVGVEAGVGVGAGVEVGIGVDETEGDLRRTVKDKAEAVVKGEIVEMQLANGTEWERRLTAPEMKEI